MILNQRVYHCVEVAMPLIGAIIDNWASTWSILFSRVFLSSEQTSLGLLGQYIELRWVQENMKAFARICVWCSGYFW